MTTLGHNQHHMMLTPMALHNKRSHGAPHFNCFELKGFMALFTMPVATLMPVASHDEKCHVSPLFYYLDLKNSVAPLILLFASHDVSVIT